MASFPSKILLLSISSTPRSGHGDGEGDGEGDGDHGTDTTEKKKKKATREIASALPRRLPWLTSSMLWGMVGARNRTTSLICFF